VSSKLEQKIKSLLAATQKAKADERYEPGRVCIACRSDNPPPFCSCIAALYSSDVFAYLPENSTLPIYYNFDPNFTPPPGDVRYMEWPSHCPALSQMLAPAFNSQAEWDAVKTSWVTRIARGLMSDDPNVYEAAWKLHILCHPSSGWPHIAIERSCSNYLLQGVVLECMHNLKNGLPCSGPRFDHFWEGEYSGIPGVPYIARYLMDNGCLPGQQVPGACCSVAGDFGGFSCAEVGGPEQCLNGTFHPGKTCAQIGGDNCGKSKVSVITPSKKENRQLGTASITDMIIRALKGSV
jgi:hypothetical protein